MKLFMLAIGMTVGLLSVSSANAQIFVDYTLNKGLWHITVIDVDPGHIDEYIK